MSANLEINSVCDGQSEVDNLDVGENVSSLDVGEAVLCSVTNESNKNAVEEFKQHVEAFDVVNEHNEVINTSESSDNVHIDVSSTESVALEDGTKCVSTNYASTSTQTSQEILTVHNSSRCDSCSGIKTNRDSMDWLKTEIKTLKSMADLDSKHDQLRYVNELGKTEEKFADKFESLERKYYKIKSCLESRSECESTIRRKYGKMKVRLIDAEGILGSVGGRLAAVENNYTFTRALAEKYGRLKVRLQHSEKQNVIMENRLAAVERELLTRRFTATRFREAPSEPERSTTYGKGVDERRTPTAGSTVAVATCPPPPPPPPPPPTFPQRAAEGPNVWAPRPASATPRGDGAEPSTGMSDPGERVKKNGVARFPVTADMLSSVKLRRVAPEPASAVLCGDGVEPRTGIPDLEAWAKRNGVARYPITVDMLNSVKLRHVAPKPESATVHGDGVEPKNRVQNPEALRSNSAGCNVPTTDAMSESVKLRPVGMSESLSLKDRRSGTGTATVGSKKPEKRTARQFLERLGLS